MRLSTDVSTNTTKIKKKKKYNKRHWQLVTLCFLPVLLVFVFAYIPMFGIIIAFKDYRFDKGIFGSEWVGFRNFEFFFKSDTFARITWNTLSMNFIFIFIGLVAALTMAIMMFNVTSRARTKVFQTVMITPRFISWVVASYMLYVFLQPQYGLLNQLLEKLGMGKVDWYSEPGVWPVILTIASVWKGVGLDSVMYYAALMGVDTSLIEAAQIDGASKWKVIKHVMIPTLVPLIITLTILSIGGIFRADFGLFYQLPRNVGALYETTDVVDTYVFRALNELGDISMSSAVGLLQSVVGFVMVMLTNRIAKKIDPDSGLF